LRFDSTLLGYKKLKSIRGNISVLFKGRTPKGQEKDNNEGELLMIDHDKKQVCSIFEDAMASAKLQRDIDNIIDGEHVQKHYKLESFKIEPDKQRNGKPNFATIEGYQAEKYKAQTIYEMIKFKLMCDRQLGREFLKSIPDF
jgi:hypothetical protein